MEINASELLSGYKKNKARLLIIRAILDAVPAEVMSDDAKLVEMAIRRRPSDGMPVSAGQGSSTEYVAIHYQSEAERDRAQYRLDIKALEDEFRDIDQQIVLHDAALKVLSSTEKELVRLHYDELLSLSQMIEDRTLSERVHSLSSLRRMHRSILRKVDEVLKPRAIHKRVV